MLKQLHNVKVVLCKNDPYVIDTNDNIVLSDYYKFRPMKQKYNVHLTEKFNFDILCYIPCESNIYHATVFSSFYLSCVPKSMTVLSNSCDVFDFYALHFNKSCISKPGIYFVKTLYYFQMNCPNYNIPTQFDQTIHNLFMQQTKNLCKIDKSSPSYIYIKRNTKYRNIYNYEEIENMLLKKGFKTIVMESFSLEAQINFYFNASCIIGIHGAGLTNIIYCKKSCKIIELKHKGMNSFLIHNCYGQLAKVSDLNNYIQYYSPYKHLPNTKSKDFHLEIDSSALSIKIDNLLKST
jgi:hypothetical protein